MFTSLCSAGRITAVAACLGVGALAGCGGGSSSFTSKADSICKKQTSQANALTQPANPTDARALATYLDQLIPSIQTAYSQIQGINPPSNKSSAYQQWLSTLRQVQSLLRQADSAAHSGDASKAVTLLQQAAPLSDQSKSQAKALGFSECAK